MRSATLRFRSATDVVEFRIVAFDQGGVSAWRMVDGRATGRSIDFNDSDTPDEIHAIQKAADVLTTWHPGLALDLQIELMDSEPRR